MTGDASPRSFEYSQSESFGRVETFPRTHGTKVQGNGEANPQGVQSQCRSLVQKYLLIPSSE